MRRTARVCTVGLMPTTLRNFAHLGLEAFLVSADFAGLVGMQFDDPFEDFKLKKVTNWSSQRWSDEDGDFIRFALTADFAYGKERQSHDFTLWIGQDGDAYITDLVGEQMEPRVRIDKLSRLLKKLKAI